MPRRIVDSVEIAGTLKATGATDFDSTLNVDGVTTHVGDVIVSIIRRATETSLLALFASAGLVAPGIVIRGENAGVATDGNIEYISSNDIALAAVGDHVWYIHDGTSYNLFAAMRAASWRYELSAPGVAHGMTTIVPTSAFGAFYPTSLTAGGLSVIGLSDIDAFALVLAGYSGGATPTVAPVLFYSAKKSGTGSQALAAAEPAFAWQNLSTVLATMLGNGNLSLIGALNVDGLAQVKAGSSANDAKVGGVLYVSTATGNSGAVASSTMGTYTVPANTLAVDGQSIWFEASGTIANGAAIAELAVTLDNGPIGSSEAASTITTGGFWSLRGRIIRTGATTQKAFVEYFIQDGNVSVISTKFTAALVETLSNALDLDIDAHTDGTAADMTLETFIVGWDAQNT